MILRELSSQTTDWDTSIPDDKHEEEDGKLRYRLAYLLGMGVRNQLLEYSSLQMNLVGGQANLSLHIHTQTSFLKQMYTFFVWRHWRVPCAQSQNSKS